MQTATQRMGSRNPRNPSSSAGLRAILCTWALCFACAPQSLADTIVRVATYNIRHLSDDLNDTRKGHLEDVIEHLEADVIGLQEIDDRAALRVLFPEADWQVLIDDDSGFTQDVALVVRRPLHFVGHATAGDRDADDVDFLFPVDATHNAGFPNNRDALFGEIQVCDGCPTLTVVVIHAKARPQCRRDTDVRRELAAQQLVTALDRFEDRFFVLLGDFNDNPDDRSMNILETGDPDAAGGAENDNGAFLVNLTERLLTDDHVSWGLKSNAIVGSGDDRRIDTRTPGSRDQNNVQRGTCGEASDILFDQLLIPATTTAMYVSDSVRVFDHPSGVIGNNNTRASDHLLVYADFLFIREEDDGAPAPSGVVIHSLLPNPDQRDAGNEVVTLRNAGSQSVDLIEWVLADAAGHSVRVDALCAHNNQPSTLAGQSVLTLRLPANVLPLTNNGDTISLLNADGDLAHRVSYTREQARSGVTIAFP